MNFLNRAKELFRAKWPSDRCREDGTVPEGGVRGEDISLDKARIPICYRCGHAAHVYLSGDSQKCRQRIRRLSAMDCPKCHRAKMTQAKTKPLNPVLRETIIISRFLLWLLFKTVEITFIIVLCILVGGCYYCAGKKYPSLK